MADRSDTNGSEPESRPDNGIVLPELSHGQNEVVPIADEVGDLSAVHAVPVRMQAILGRSRITIDDLLRMRAGIVLELDRRVGQPVDLLVNDRLIGRGEVVIVDDSLGVTLTEIVRPAK